MNRSIYSTEVIKVNGQASAAVQDILATEEPLEIRIGYGPLNNRLQKSISVTMRTPGNDAELATGFLFTEGIIEKNADILSITHTNGIDENTVQAELDENIAVVLENLDRNSYTTSSCGVCGKSSLQAIRTIRRQAPPLNTNETFSSDIIHQLPGVLRSNQNIFENTGGLHACALFDTNGKMVICHEDVGRHNALDKLIGAALQKELFPLSPYPLLLSGRASFELVQKAWMAGIQIIAAVGAPSSLAVQTAQEHDITLIGFLRNHTFNIYTGQHRINIPAYENSYQG